MNASLDLTQLVRFTRQQAAEYLNLHLPFKSTQQWLNYLNDNARGKHANSIHFVKKGVASFYQRHCLDVFIARKNEELYRQVQHLLPPQQNAEMLAQPFAMAHDIYLTPEDDTVAVRVQAENTVLKLSFGQAKQLMQQLAHHLAQDQQLSRST